MRLTRKLEQLPAVKAALAEIGYTKAREIIAVASAGTEVIVGGRGEGVVAARIGGEGQAGQS
jgi:hypothetical protein